MQGRLFISVIMGLALVTGRAVAWDDFGHMEVATVAYSRLSTTARKRATELLKKNPRYQNWTAGYPEKERDRVAFVVAATWADGIKTSSMMASRATVAA